MVEEFGRLGGLYMENQVVGRIKQLNREKMNFLSKASQDFKKQGLPWCSKCYQLDEQEGKLKPLDVYSKNFEVRRVKEIEDNRTSSPNYGKVLRVIVDFVCPLKHGCSLDFGVEEWEKLRKKV